MSSEDESLTESGSEYTGGLMSDKADDTSESDIESTKQKGRTKQIPDKKAKASKPPPQVILCFYQKRCLSLNAVLFVGCRAHA